MENQIANQRRFAVMGMNTFKIAKKLISNDKLCRLLKYQTRNPLLPVDPVTGKEQPDFDGAELMNRQILIIPKIYDDSIEKMSYVTAVFNDFLVNQLNPEFKISTIRFDIACPYDEWVLDDRTLRPYLIMQEIDTMFNEEQLAGIGTLQFYRADALTLSPWIGGYSMKYKINEFN